MLKHEDFKGIIIPDRKYKSHIRITNEILKSPEWGRFTLTREAAVWFFLCGWIVRGKMNTAGMANKFYRDYYLGQRKLVARWNQGYIAEHLGFSSKGYISELIRRLEEDWKAIKRIKIPSYDSYQMNLYEFGYVNKYDEDVFYLFENIYRRINDRETSRLSVEEEPVPKNYLPLS